MSDVKVRLQVEIPQGSYNITCNPSVNVTVQDTVESNRISNSHNTTSDHSQNKGLDLEKFMGGLVNALDYLIG